MQKSLNVDTHLRLQIINALVECKALTREELCEYLEMPRTTLYDNLEKLMKRGELTREPLLLGKRGRPIILWKIRGA